MIDNTGEGHDPGLLILQGLVLDRLLDDPGQDLCHVALLVMVMTGGEALLEVLVAVSVMTAREVAALRVTMNVDVHIGGEVVQDRSLGDAVGVETVIIK